MLRDVYFCSIYILWFNIRTHERLNFSCYFNGTLHTTKFHLDLFMFSELKHVDRRRDTTLNSCPSCIDRMMTPNLKFRAVFTKLSTVRQGRTVSCLALFIGGSAQQNFGFYLHLYEHAYILFSTIRRKYD